MGGKMKLDLISEKNRNYQKKWIAKNRKKRRRYMTDYYNKNKMKYRLYVENYKSKNQRIINIKEKNKQWLYRQLSSIKPYGTSLANPNLNKNRKGKILLWVIKTYGKEGMPMYLGKNIYSSKKRLRDIYSMFIEYGYCFMKNKNIVYVNKSRVKGLENDKDTN